ISPLIMTNDAFSQHGVDQNFNIDFVIGGVHASRVVNSVHIDQDPMTCCFDSPSLGGTEVASFADDFSWNLCTIDANCISRQDPCFIVSFSLCIDVDTDSSVVDEIHECLQYGLE